MPRNGSGTYAAPSNSFNPAISGATPTAADWTAFLADLSTAITGSLAADGQTTASARIPFAAGIGVTTGGVQFPATQSASADVNNLDDYEEGTFTPAVTFGGAAVGITYSAQVGRYTKIGNRVMFSLDVVLSNKGSSTGAALVTGLPFTTLSALSQSFSTWLHAFTGLSGAIQCFSTNTTTIGLYHLGTGTATGITNNEFSNTSEVIITGSYQI